MDSHWKTDLTQDGGRKASDRLVNYLTTSNFSKSEIAEFQSLFVNNEAYLTGFPVLESVFSYTPHPQWTDSQDTLYIWTRHPNRFKFEFFLLRIGYKEKQQRGITSLETSVARRLGRNSPTH